MKSSLIFLVSAVLVGVSYQLPGAASSRPSAGVSDEDPAPSKTDDTPTKVEDFEPVMTTLAILPNGKLNYGGYYYDDEGNRVPVPSEPEDLAIGTSSDPYEQKAPEEEQPETLVGAEAAVQEDETDPAGQAQVNIGDVFDVENPVEADADANNDPETSPAGQGYMDIGDTVDPESTEEQQEIPDVQPASQPDQEDTPVPPPRSPYNEDEEEQDDTISGRD
jgi:hypothetical protein